MSTTFRLISAVAFLLTTASATFIEPKENSSWDVNSQHQIQWDPVGLVEPLAMHLAPAGTTESSSYISTLAPCIPNLGSWSWLPTQTIPQHHKSLIIIIVDSGGKHQYSPPFQMIGWPQVHTTIAAPVHHTTTSVHVVAPIVHTSIVAPVHTTSVHVIAPIVHTSIAMPLIETVVAPPVHTVAPPVHSAIVVTSLHIAPIVHTSQPAPIIKTIESPPLVQTEEVAPIIMTQTQEPVTKIVTQPALQSTEFPEPIVKTILVTETQAPIIHQVSQPALTLVETIAPVILTEIQAPIVKTLTQAPHVVTEHLAPILVTSEVTQTHLMTSLIVVAPVHTMAPPVHTVAPPAHVVSPPAHIVAPPVHTVAPPAHIVAPPAHTTLVVVHTPVGVIPTFSNSTTSRILSFTTPLALAASEGVPTGTGSGSLQPTFIPNAASRSGVSGGLVGGLTALMMFLI